ncbi:MAG UNVERIFIED_CONTAM: hypothetical protein LVT10_13910 [Anaerolineae bacterium]
MSSCMNGRCGTLGNISGRPRAYCFTQYYPYAERQTAVETRLQTVKSTCPTLQLQASLLNDENIRAKIGAMQAYRSQVSSFWQDEEDLAQTMRAYLQRQSTNAHTFTEPYYQCM